MMKIVEVPKYGPLFRFQDHHVYRTMRILSDGRRRGRKRLAEAVGVGEGSMRKILEVLKERDLVEIRQTGVRLTPVGVGYFEDIPLDVHVLGVSDISLGEFNVAVKIAGSSNRVRSGLEQRDAALKAGADGATTIIMQRGKLLVPPDFDLDDRSPKVTNELRSIFKVRNGDVIVIGTSIDPVQAENGALAAAFELI